ncbi:PEP-CTERM sorting domain-containing protein [Salinimonas marina]|nr:PEP-CTERM sorting domain-containing protein [Salinimonas marina]
MKNKLLKGVLASFALTVGGIANADVVYLDSDAGNPWGETTNEAALDGVFGAGNWTDSTFESINVTNLFSSANDFIYLEGSDLNADALELFINTNSTAMQDWVFGGGRIFINAAPNEGDGMDFGFGVSLHYPVYDNDVYGVNPAHAIFEGPYGSTGSNFQGTYFSHGAVSGLEINALIVDELTSDIVLGDMFYGTGYAVFGGMTTSNFQTPNAFELRQNILHYATNVQTTDVPEPSTLVIFSLGLLGLASRKYKK